jgi:uncharacterized protein YukJ
MHGQSRLALWAALADPSCPKHATPLPSQFTGRDADLDETLTRPLKRNVKERKRVVCSV